MNIDDKKNVIVIGAGPAGLFAAWELLKNTDIKPIIVEETDYIGGISRTHVYNDYRMDLGGHRFFTKSDTVMNAWLELFSLQSDPAKDDILLNRNVALAKNGKDPEIDEEVFLVRNRLSRIYFLKKFFDYPISLSLQTVLNLGFINLLNAGFCYLWSMIFKRQENSLEDFYINRFGKGLYKMFFEDYTEKLWGIHPSKINPDWGAQRVKGLSLLKILQTAIGKIFHIKQNLETSLIEEFYYPKKGPGQLYEYLAQKIIENGGTILKNSKVIGIEILDNNVKSVVIENQQNGEKQTISTDAVFSSMPIKDLVNAMGEAVSEEVKNIAKNLPYRDFRTVGLLVKNLEIKNNTKIKTINNIVPDCWIYIQEKSVKLGRLQVFNNWSPYLLKDCEQGVWLGLEYFCSEGDTLWEMNDTDFIEMASNELEQIGIISKKNIIDSTSVKVKKAYPAYFGAYKDFDIVKKYLSDIENLYCIGRNGQHKYNNMDHSILTAIEAVNVYRNENKNKEDIWNVNTEREYHESK